MFPGKPCFFVEIGKGCKDYKNRPEDPCKTFECGWLKINEMPEEFKPEKSGVIMQYRENNNNPYLVIHKAPNNISASFLSWSITYALNNKLNILWYIDEKSWWIGNEDFRVQMEEEHKDV